MERKSIQKCLLRVIDIEMKNDEKKKKPIKSDDRRGKDGRFGIGNNANPAGRPKGQTLKERVREMLANMTPGEEKEFLKKVGAGDIWRMAEGNPHQTKDITSGGKPIGNLLDDLEGDE